MIKESTSAILTAARMLSKDRRALVLMLAVYAALLAAIYLFVSTREATISQLIMTVTLIIVAPALFFLLQAASVGYVDGPLSKRLVSSGLKMVVVSLPVIGVTVLLLYALGKVDSYVTVATTLRYLLIGVVAPLLAIQLWIAASNSGFTRVHKVAVKTFAPQSMFVYACGFLIFAVAPYFLIVQTISTERAWLELSLLVLRLFTAALLALFGWVITVGAISIQVRRERAAA